MSVESELITGWLRARSFARGLPAPVADHGGWRVDTQLPDELQRYVFAGVEDGLRQLADEIVTPKIFLKLCGSEQELQALLPPRWQLQDLRYVMTGEDFCVDDISLAPGYTVQLTSSATATTARILTDTGELAASGDAAEYDGFFIYDRIATQAEHRRRGLGACLMRALHSTRRSSASTQILVATAAGQRLYSSLGWRIRSPYTTAHIPC
ncbi:GNAT family N-acetyltransferase [Undibacterium sp. Di26W]|uniref:GNAT family N-acetyltransferase n=1 Tax=Undibacterium sp. Di26W TaxID=3413035 RepID=UPI003BF12A47